MINRIEDFVLPQKSVAAEANPAHRLKIDVGKSLASIAEWTAQHPVACLAAAFIFGGAVAWIVKRR
jgi:hypothetical protein